MINIISNIMNLFGMHIHEWSKWGLEELTEHHRSYHVNITVQCRKCNICGFREIKYL